MRRKEEPQAKGNQALCLQDQKETGCLGPDQQQSEEAEPFQGLLWDISDQLPRNLLSIHTNW